jgi:chromosome segregation ATPase
MSETFWESDTAVETVDETVSPSVGPSASIDQQQGSHEDAPALAVSVDDFAALEERIHRAASLVKRERQARAGAEARSEELEARVTQTEAQMQAQSHAMEQLQNELHALRAEREQVRQRVERLLKQLDTLEL